MKPLKIVSIVFAFIIAVVLCLFLVFRSCGGPRPAETPAFVPGTSTTLSPAEVLSRLRATTETVAPETPRSAFTYTVESGKAAITGLTEEGKKLSVLDVPAEIEGCPVTAIAPYAFSGQTGLKRVRLPESVISIGKAAFDSCHALMSVNMPSSLQIIEKAAFSGCYELKNVKFPPNLAAIGDAAFYGSGLRNVSFPSSSSLTSIGDAAFGSCSYLTNVSLPPWLRSLGEYAFDGCTTLRTLTSYAETPPVGIFLFGSCFKLTAIKVPAGSVETYKAAQGWLIYSNKIVSQ